MSIISDAQTEIKGVTLSAFGKVYLEVRPDKRIYIDNRVETRAAVIAKILLDWGRAFAEETSLGAPSRVQTVPNPLPKPIAQDPAFGIADGAYGSFTRAPKKQPTEEPVLVEEVLSSPQALDDKTTNHIVEEKPHRKNKKHGG